MEAWLSAIIEVLWRNGLAVVPLAVLVAGICRWVPSRPATRHTLWVLVLLWFVVPPVLPDLKFDTFAEHADRFTESAPPRLAAVSPAEPASTEEDARSATDESFTLPGIISTDSAGLVPTEPGGSAETWTVARAEPVSTDWFAASLETAERLSNPPDALHEETASRTNVTQRSNEESANRSDDDPAHGQTSLPMAPTEKARPTPRNQPNRRSQRLRVASAGVAMNASADAVPIGADDAEASLAHDEQLTYEAPPSAATTASSSDGGWRAWVAGLGAVRDATGRIPTMPVGVWALGIVVLVTWRGHRFVRFHRRIAHGTPAPSSTIALVNEAARALGLRRTPETWMVDDCLSPMLWCGRKARMLLPVQLWSQLDRASRRAVIYHELAHLRRGDHWVRRIESVVHTVCWWHPVAWWARNRIHEEAELCCDAWVTWLLPEARRTYAETLLKARHYISSQPDSVPALGIGITTRRTKRFARRLTMVMTESVVPKGSVWGVALAACVVLLAGWVATPARSAPPQTDAALAEVDVAADAALADDVVVDVSAVVGVSPAVAEKLEELREALKSDDAQVRREAITRADDIGAAAAPSLRLALSDNDASVRHRAADVLYDLGVKAWPILMPDPMLNVAPHPAPVLPAAPPLAPTLYTAPVLPTAPHLAPTLYTAPVPHIAPTPHPPHVADLHFGHDASPQIAWGPYPGAGPSTHEEHGAPLGSRFSPGAGPNTYEEHVARRRSPLTTECDDGIIVRSYRLPKGKLGALTRLMVRADVPIRIRPHDERIEVHATEAQHKAFKGFLDIIHPGENHADTEHGAQSSSDFAPNLRQRRANQQQQNLRRQVQRTQRRSQEARSQRERQRVQREKVQRDLDRYRAQREWARATRESNRAQRERDEQQTKDPCEEQSGAAAKALDRAARAAAEAGEQAMRQLSRVHEHAQREAIQGAERAQHEALKAAEVAQRAAMRALEQAMREAQDASRAIEEVVEEAIRAAQQGVREALDELKDATKHQSEADHDHDHDDDSDADESEETEANAVAATVY